MKKIVVLVVMLLSLVTLGFGQTKKTTQFKPIVLSDWMRHVGLHYVELVSKEYCPDDWDRPPCTSFDNFHDQKLYGGFVDDMDAQLNIDAHGSDRVFWKEILQRMRQLMFLTELEVNHYGSGQTDKFWEKFRYYNSCKDGAEQAIESGTFSKLTMTFCYRADDVGTEPAAAQATPPSTPSAPGVVKHLGSIRKISGTDLTLATSQGTELVVRVAPHARLLRLAPGQTDLKSAAPIQLSDFQVNDRVLVRGTLSADGSIDASAVVVMKQQDITQKNQQ